MSRHFVLILCVSLVIFMGLISGARSQQPMCAWNTDTLAKNGCIRNTHCVNFDGTATKVVFKSPSCICIAVAVVSGNFKSCDDVGTDDCDESTYTGEVHVSVGNDNDRASTFGEYKSFTNLIASDSPGCGGELAVKIVTVCSCDDSPGGREICTESETAYYDKVSCDWECDDQDPPPDIEVKVCL